MAMPFARSLRSLEVDGHRRSVALAAAASLLFGAWVAWALLARVTIYATSPSARLETAEPLHRVEAPTDGRVVEVLVQLGDAVDEGQPLVRLESARERLELEEAEARASALRAQIAPLAAELAAASDALDQGQATARGALSEAGARARAAATSARAARERSQRLEQLSTSGASTEEASSQALADAERQTSEAEAASFAIERLRGEHVARHTDARARIEAIRVEIARIDGESAAADATVDRLRHEIDRREIVAPIAGRIARIEALSEGSYVARGAHLVSLLPRAELRIVAHFRPGDAFGRIRTGQRAAMRLDGFPWVRFGVLEARVARVAEETGPDGVRVELEPIGAAAFPAPLEHGLPGQLEIAVEEVSPAELLLRAGGRWVAPPGHAVASR
jgi:membrane fusion protein (multidrug efflux system)